MQERHKIPATLVVVCTEPGVGEWAAEPHWFGAEFARTAMPHPIVLSMENIPKVTNVDDAERDIPLAMLSVVVHVADRDHHQIMQALRIAMRDRKPGGDLVLWRLLVEKGLGRSKAADIWRDMVRDDAEFFTGPTSELLRDQGRAQQRAQDIVRILRSRGVESSEADRERILGCANAEVLEVWLDRAVHVATSDELWDTGHVGAQRSGGGGDGHRSLVS